MKPQSESGIVVVVPCHNEEGRIGKVVSAVRMRLPKAEVVVIDDGSSDNSASEALEAGATVLRHASNLGYGVALETGYVYAVSQNASCVLQMDGDGQHLPEELPLLLSILHKDEADIVIGSRYGHPQSLFRPDLVRRIGHRFFALLIFIVSGHRFKDPTSGFQGLNRAALNLLTSGVLPYDYPDSDVILMALMSGLRIKEIPVRMLPRCAGKSMHSGLKPIYYGLKMTLSMFIVLLNFRIWHKWRSVLSVRSRAEREG